MFSSVPKEIINSLYIKALNQHLRRQDEVSVTKIVNACFQEFLAISQKTDIVEYFEHTKKRRGM